MRPYGLPNATVWIVAGLTVWAAGVEGRLTGRVLAAGSNRVVLLDGRGAVVWEHPAGLVHDAWMLPNGNVLFADGQAVSEVTPEHRAAPRWSPPSIICTSTMRAGRWCGNSPPPICRGSRSGT